jgi:hypothetical protein
MKIKKKQDSNNPFKQGHGQVRLTIRKARRYNARLLAKALKKKQSNETH